MSLTMSQRRSWARWGDREIQRTIDEATSQIATDSAARALAAKVARVNRPPKQRAVMPAISVGDQIRPCFGNNLLTVAKVNRMSVTTVSGTRYSASEISAVVRCGQ